MRPDLAILNRLPAAGPIVLGLLASACLPRDRMSISELAEEKRVISAESGSRYPGPWRNARAPHMVEVMDALGPDDPCEDVVMMTSAQVAKTETAINFFLHIVDQEPGPAIIVLPSHDEAGKFVNTKLQPAIDVTPALNRKVLETAGRNERGSTASFKRFPGGFAQITFAGSSKGLQMITARYTLGDEVDEWPAEAGTRGDPVSQLKKRTEIYERDRKRLWTSTPSVAGHSRIAQMYGESDQRKRYVPCPSCGSYQVLSFEALRWDDDLWPHNAFFECLAHGCVIAAEDRAEMLQAGVWVPTAGDDAPGPWVPAGEIAFWRDREVPSRVRGYHVWKAYSLFTSWNGIVQEFIEARDVPERMRVFTQQVLGEPWEEKGEAPDADKLYLRRVTGIARSRPPVGPVVFTGATDVQGNRLEWAVWGWSEGMTRWLIDWGVIEGDPEDRETWLVLDEVRARSYSAGHGQPMPADLWAVDTGYKSHTVYDYCRARQGVMAIDGRDGRTLPYLGSPRKVDVNLDGRLLKNGAVLWPVGTFPAKSDLYASIRRTIEGPDESGLWRPGSMILPGDVDLAYCEQLTSEYLASKEHRSGVTTQSWDKLKGRPNEALDIAVYARAMAYHLRLDLMTAEDWQALRVERFGHASDDAAARLGQGDFFTVAIAPSAPVAPVSATPSDQEPRQMQSNDTERDGNWLRPLRGTW